MVVAVVVVVAFAWGFAKLTSDDGGVENRPLGAALPTQSIGTSAKVRLSPDGAHLALVESGILSIIRVRDASIASRAGTRVVDATWMPDGSRVVIVEGPIPTGQIAAVDLQGKTAGVVRTQTVDRFR